MISRRGFITGTAALLAAPLDTEAQQAKVARLGLFHVGLDHDPPGLAPLRESLKGLGYEDGKSAFAWTIETKDRKSVV